MILCEKDIFKRAAFNYGHDITISNRFLNFFDGSSEKTATLPTRSFTLGQMADIIAAAMNDVGEQEYTVTLDRNGRYFTISADSNFSLLIDSGTNKGQSAFALLGFTGIADLTGTNSYISNESSGSQYITQTPIANFLSFERTKKKLESVVRKTPTNIREAISYGTEKLMRLDMPLITDIESGGNYLRQTSNGVGEADDLMTYLIDQKAVEFLEDVNLVNEFTPCVLNKTSTSPNGTGFQMKKVRNLGEGYFQITGLEFSEIEV